MCVAHGKEISDWLATNETLELVMALASDLGKKAIDGNSGKTPNSAKTRDSATYSTLELVKLLRS